MAEISPTGHAILNRMEAGGRLMAQRLETKPSCPYWEGTPDVPPSRTVQSLFTKGLIGWKGRAPEFPNWGELEVSASRLRDTKGGEP